MYKVLSVFNDGSVFVESTQRKENDCTIFATEEEAQAAIKSHILPIFEGDLGAVSYFEVVKSISRHRPELRLISVPFNDPESGLD